MQGLAQMSCMIAICYSSYGAKTESAYASFQEVTHAIQNNLPIIPLRLCDEWPPCPDPAGDQDGEGKIQNLFVFKKSVAYVEGRGKTPAQCAQLIIENAGSKLPMIP